MEASRYRLSLLIASLMKHIIVAGVLAASMAAPAPVGAQAVPEAPAQAVAVGATQAAEPVVAQPGGVRRFVRDVGGDYTHFFSWSTAKWLGVGGLATAAIYPADEEIGDATDDGDVALLSQSTGQTYGNLSLQIPLAVGWWVVGRAAGSTRAAEAGRDLVRAQISAASWTYLIKYAVDRTRPNGDPRGFPSGHSSATFATAMVLQEHYGWKLGVPFFAMSAYTAATRVADNKHWASDVMFGAFVGMTSGRTVTVRLRGKAASIAPMAVPGGGGVMVRVGAID